MSAKSNGPKWPHRVLWLAIFLVALAAIVARPGNAGPKGDTTGTVSKAEPPVKQDGTPAHPYADASQCPSSTDVVIWQRDRAIPPTWWRTAAIGILQLRHLRRSLHGIIDDNALRIISFGDDLEDAVLEIFVIDQPIIN
jgi:hypothetical protein